jgi:hypothetical protein
MTRDLSGCLDQIAAWLGKYRDTGVQLEPHAVAALAATLTALAETARDLEHDLSPGVPAIEDMTNVVVFPGSRSLHGPAWPGGAA